MEFSFKCSRCEKVHEGIPTYGFSFPDYYWVIPEDDRSKRGTASSDFCTVDDEFFFIRGCIEIPVIDHSDSFIWGVWVSLSRDNFLQYQRYFKDDSQSTLNPTFGWLSNEISVYPSTENLKTMVHYRDGKQRPYIELEPTDHPLSVEQKSGISLERVVEIFQQMPH